MSVRIDGFETIPLAIPLRTPVKMSGDLIATADIVVVCVHFSDGTTGWGEAPAAPKMTGETVDGITIAARRLGESIVGSRMARLGDIPLLIAESGSTSRSARSAAQMAMLDALAKARGMPVCDLIGLDRHVAPLRSIALLANGDTARDVEDAKCRRAEGFMIFKLKVGIDPLEVEVARIREVRSVLGAEAVLSIDANGGFTINAAATLLAAVDGLGLAFLEQPLPPGSEAETATLAKTSNVPIAMDESVRSVTDLIFFENNKGFGGASLKFIKFGGMLAVRNAAQYCESAGLKVNLAGKIAETSISAAALAHVAATIQPPEWGVSPTHSYLESDICTKPVGCPGGCMEGPRDRPGLGVDVDPLRVLRFRSEPSEA